MTVARRAGPLARVLMVVENQGYPQDARVRPEALALTAAGYDVTVIAPGSPGQPSTEVVDGVRVHRYPAPRSGGGAAGYAWEYLYATAASLVLVIRVLVGRGFDVIHLHNPPDTLWVAALPAKIAGKVCIFDHHDLAPELYDAVFAERAVWPLRWTLRLMERVSFRLADHVISTNESYREIAIKRGKVARMDTTVVRNGPDLDRMRSVEPDPDVRRRAAAIVGYVGVMGTQDGLDHLLRAVGHLVHTLGRRDFLFMLIGYGDALDQLKRLARELGIEDCVWFTGPIHDDDVLRRYLSAADICVTPDPANPYTDRSTMIKMMEYMALAKPVVAYDLRENRASGGDAAVYVPGDDHAAFAVAIRDLMDDPERRQRMGEMGRERVEGSLTWNHSVPHLLDAYRAALSARRSDRDPTTGP